jgi:hypothetical protein
MESFQIVIQNIIFHYNETTGYLKFRDVGENLLSHGFVTNVKSKSKSTNSNENIDERWNDKMIMRRIKIARVSYVNALQGIERAFNDRFFNMPCNLNWNNANNRRFPVSRKTGKCLRFVAASYGDIFVVFATNPNNEWSWYYFQISSYGVALFKVKTKNKELNLIDL